MRDQADARCALPVPAPSMFQSVAYVPTDHRFCRISQPREGGTGPLVARPAFVLSNSIHSFIHPSIYPVSNRDTTVNKTDKNPRPNRAATAVGQTRCKIKK